MPTINYDTVETMNSTIELDKCISEALDFIEKLKERREVVTREERVRKERRWVGLGETVESVVGEEVELNVFKHWMVGSSESLKAYIQSQEPVEFGQPAKSLVARALAGEALDTEDFEMGLEEDRGVSEDKRKALNERVAQLAAAFKPAESSAEGSVESLPTQEVAVKETRTVRESPKQVTARVMREILPNTKLSRAHINELIQAADHGVDFETIRLFAEPELSLQQVRAARAAAEREVHED